MPVGLGARTNNSDTTYVANNTVQDGGNLRQPGGAVVQPFYGSATVSGDTSKTWVWGITIASAVIVVGLPYLMRTSRRILG